MEVSCLHTPDNDVNKLSISAAYFIFLFSVGFCKMLAVLSLLSNKRIFLKMYMNAMSIIYILKIGCAFEKIFLFNHINYLLEYLFEIKIKFFDKEGYKCF